MLEKIITEIKSGKVLAIARGISLVENSVAGYEKLLQHQNFSPTPIIGITGPPGAGKSTITNGLIKYLLSLDKKIAVLCVDPSSPFNLGAILGDRIRMGDWYGDPRVYIRSVATRGALGGLSSKIIEMTDLLRLAPFDYIIVETVGIGQSEIDIAGLADVTVVTLVPESGDEVQAMKSGMMEVADIFAINKTDRPGAETFIKNLKSMIMPNSATAAMIPVVKLVAIKQEGIEELFSIIEKQLQQPGNSKRKSLLLAEKAWQLIQHKRMAAFHKQDLIELIERKAKDADFNLYNFVEELLKKN